MKGIPIGSKSAKTIISSKHRQQIKHMGTEPARSTSRNGITNSNQSKVYGKDQTLLHANEIKRTKITPIIYQKKPVTGLVQIKSNDEKFHEEKRDESRYKSSKEGV